MIYGPNVSVYSETMAKILMVWELGGGLGHLMRLLGIARPLVARGHEVTVALKDLTHAQKVYGGTGIRYLQAPSRDRKKRRRPKGQWSFLSILYASGWSDEQTLGRAADAWRNLFQVTSPDVALFDHSPTALLGSRGLDMKRIVVGSGFFHPPDVSPWPLLTGAKAEPAVAEALALEESRVLAFANRSLDSWGAPPPRENGRPLFAGRRRFFHNLQRTRSLFRLAWRTGDPLFRSSAHQSWAVSGVAGRPRAEDFPLPEAFSGTEISDRGAPITRISDPCLPLQDLDPARQRQLQTQSLRFVNGPLDMHQVSATCDLAILSGSHGTTDQMLLEGKPTMQIPRFSEQSLFSRTVQQMGAGLTAHPRKGPELVQKLRSLLDNLDDYGGSARQFAQRYSGFDPVAEHEALADRVEALLGDGNRSFP